MTEDFELRSGLQYYINRLFCPKYGEGIFSCNNILSAGVAGHCR